MHCAKPRHAADAIDINRLTGVTLVTAQNLLSYQLLLMLTSIHWMMWVWNCNQSSKHFSCL